MRNSKTPMNTHLHPSARIKPDAPMLLHGATRGAVEFKSAHVSRSRRCAGHWALLLRLRSAGRHKFAALRISPQREQGDPAP